MSAFRITAAHEDDAHVEFELPRPDGSVFEFKVPKYQFIPNPIAEKFRAWFEARVAEEHDEKDDEGNVVKEGKPMTRFEVLEKLFSLLLPTDVCKDLKKLTIGELTQIEEHWTDESAVSVGESSASES